MKMKTKQKDYITAEEVIGIPNPNYDESKIASETRKFYSRNSGINLNTFKEMHDSSDYEKASEMLIKKELSKIK